jgi:inner membrane transporter RhtA
VAFFARPAGVAFAVCAIICAQVGVVASVPLMTAEGSFRISALRVLCAALIVLAVVRPRLQVYDRRQWKAAAALGVAMSVMLMCYFAAVTRIPAGIAVAIQFLGPVGVAVYAMTGWSRAILPGLAALGIAAMSLGDGGWLLAPLGVAFALGGAVGWAAHIVLMRRIGILFSALDGLSLSLSIAAMITLPVSFLLEPGTMSLSYLPAIAGLALLLPLIPFFLEMLALRRLDLGTFSILMSLEPALGALLGYVVLSQSLSLQQMAGMLGVMSASVGAVALSSKAGRRIVAARDK